MNDTKICSNPHYAKGLCKAHYQQDWYLKRKKQVTEDSQHLPTIQEIMKS